MKLSEWLGLERGRSAALAARLNIKPPQVSDWCTGKKVVPLEHCVAIERFTNQKVTCEELLPDKAADFAYLRGLAPVEKINPDQLPVLPDSAQRNAQASGAVAAYTGPDRRVCRQPHPDLERRAPMASALAGPQGV